VDYSGIAGRYFGTFFHAGPATYGPDSHHPARHRGCGGGRFHRQVGGFIGTQMGWGQVHGFDLRSLGLAILGGVVVLFLVGLFQRGA